MVLPAPSPPTTAAIRPGAARTSDAVQGQALAVAHGDAGQAPSGLAALRLAPLRLAPLRLAPLRLAPLRLAPLRLARRAGGLAGPHDCSRVPARTGPEAGAGAAVARGAGARKARNRMVASVTTTAPSSAR